MASAGSAVDAESGFLAVQVKDKPDPEIAHRLTP
jgi:hypothetical protein